MVLPVLKYILLCKYYPSIVSIMYKYYIYAHLYTRVIRQNKYVFSRKINRKSKNSQKQPYNRLKSSRWTTIRVKGRNALCGLKKRLKSNLLIFYSIYIWKYTQFFRFHAHTRTYIRIKTQTKHTMVITTHLQKDFFKIFSFAKFEIFIFLKFFFEKTIVDTI